MLDVEKTLYDRSTHITYVMMPSPGNCSSVTKIIRHPILAFDHHADAPLSALSPEKTAAIEESRSSSQTHSVQKTHFVTRLENWFWFYLPRLFLQKQHLI